jgi:hypothetical protein
MLTSKDFQKAIAVLNGEVPDDPFDSIITKCLIELFDREAQKKRLEESEDPDWRL